jgi:hypothetical protein
MRDERINVNGFIVLFYRKGTHAYGIVRAVFLIFER